MKITAEEKQTLLDRLADMLYVPVYDPERMVTPADLAGRMHTSKEIAAADLERLVKLGRLQRVEVRLSNGKRAYAYEEKETTPE